MFKVQIMSVSPAAKVKLTHNCVQLCVSILTVLLHYRSLFLISRLQRNNFTAEGRKQLQQAAEERKSYPDFVALDLYVV